MALLAVRYAAQARREAGVIRLTLMRFSGTAISYGLRLPPKKPPVRRWCYPRTYGPRPAGSRICGLRKAHGRKF